MRASPARWQHVPHRQNAAPLIPKPQGASLVTRRSLVAGAPLGGAGGRAGRGHPASLRPQAADYSPCDRRSRAHWIDSTRTTRTDHRPCAEPVNPQGWPAQRTTHGIGRVPARHKRRRAQPVAASPAPAADRTARRRRGSDTKRAARATGRVPAARARTGSDPARGSPQGDRATPASSSLRARRSHAR